jgi:PTH1 family peptidyl-tRNA hydrolase
VGRALSGQTTVGGRLLVLAIPGVYMNLSGQTVAPLVKRFLDGDVRRLLVVHDEIDLPVGRIQVKEGGGLAGHNGLRSLKEHLHSTDFLRIRIGVGRPPGRREGADHVLKRPGKADREVLAVCVEEAADGVELILGEGVAVAMNRLNRRESPSS